MENTGKYQSHEVLRNQQPVVVLTPTCRRVKVFVLIPLFCSCDLILALWPCWYSRVFLQDLEGCLEAPEGVGACFLERVRRYKCWSCVGFFRFTSFVRSCIHIFRTDFSSMCPQKESFQMYECYCQNKPRSEALWRQFSDCSFFQVRSSRDFSFAQQFRLINFAVFLWSLTNIASIVVLFVFLLKECQKKLEHKLGLDSYLLKPIQRLTKYQLLLKVRLTLSQTGRSPAVRYASRTGYVVLYFQWDWTLLHTETIGCDRNRNSSCLLWNILSQRWQHRHWMTIGIL